MALCVCDVPQSPRAVDPADRPDWVYDPSSRERWGLDEQGRWLWHDKQDKDTSDILGKLNRLVNQVMEGAAGTVESSSSRSGMRYDAWHRLVKTTKGSLTTQYQYDALGRMVRADENAFDPMRDLPEP